MSNFSLSFRSGFRCGFGRIARTGKAAAGAALMWVGAHSAHGQVIWSSTAANALAGVGAAANWTGETLPNPGADLAFGLSTLTSVNIPGPFSIGSLSFTATDPVRPAYTFHGLDSPTLTIAGNITANTGGDITFANTLAVALTAVAHTADVANGVTVTIASNIGQTGSSASIVKAGGGTLVLSGSNTFTGSTTVGNGYLSISSDENLGVAPVSATPGHLSLSGALVATDTFVLNANRGIALTGGGFTVLEGETLTYNGIIAGSGGTFLNPDSGTLVLGGANTYTGVTTVWGGTLRAANAAALGATTGTADDSTLVTAGGHLEIDNVAVGAEAISLYGRLTGTGTASASGPITLFGATTIDGTGNLTLSGVVAGDGSSSLTKDGAGVLILTGVNTRAGVTQVEAGTLTVEDGGQLSAANAALVVNGGTLDLKTDAQTVSSLAGTGGIVALAEGTILTTNTETSDTFDGQLTGGGRLVKAGAGELTLTNSSNTHGFTTVTDGVLRVTADDALGSGELTLDGGTLELKADDELSFANAANVTGDAAIVANRENFSSSSHTHLFGPLAIGTNTLSISRGDNIGFFGTGGIVFGDTALSGDATFDIGHRAALTLGNLNDSSDGLGFTKLGTGSLILSGDGAFSGDVHIDAGTVTLAAGGSRGTGQWIVHGNSVVNVNAFGNFTNSEIGDSYFSNSAVLNLNTVEAIAGGYLAFDEQAVMEIKVPGFYDSESPTGVITGGSMDFSGTAQLKAQKSYSITGGDQNFYDGAALVGRDYDAVTGGYQYFYSEATPEGFTFESGSPLSTFLTGQDDEFVGIFLKNTARFTLNSDGSVSGGYQDFYGTSSLQANTGGAVAGGSQWFGEHAHLRASRSGSIVGGEQVFFDDAFLWATAENAVNGGVQYFNNRAGLYANAYHSVSGVSLTLADDGFIKAGTEDALGETTSIYFSGDSYYGENLTSLQTELGGVGGRLILNGFNTTVGSILSGTIEAEASTGLIENGAEGDATLTVGSTYFSELLTLDEEIPLGGFSGVIQDGGTGRLALVKAGDNFLMLSGTNTYTGGTTILEGTLLLGDGGTTGSIVGNVVNNGALGFNRSDDYAFHGEISGSGEVGTFGTGTLSLLGANTYSGATTIGEGATLALGTAGVLPDTTDVVLEPAATFLAGYSETIRRLQSDGAGGNVDIAEDTTLTLNLTSSGPESYGYYEGTLSGAGTLKVNGPGTQELDGDSSATFTGGVDISAGTLLVSNAGALGSTTVGTTVSGGTLMLSGLTMGAEPIALNGSGSMGAGALAGSGSLAGPITLHGNATISVPGETDTLTLTGGITGGVPESSTYSLTKSGAGALVLAGTASTYTGWTMIHGGSLHVDVENALPTTTALGMSANTKLFLDDSQTIQRFLGSVDDLAEIIIDAGESLTVETPGELNETGSGGHFGGVISGGGSLVVAGENFVPGPPYAFPTLLLLSGNNEYEGGTTITGGTLQIGSGGTTGSILGNVLNNGELLFHRSDDIVFAGVISGTGSLGLGIGGPESSPTGRLTLTAQNTYQGPTFISSGTLTVGIANALPAGTHVSFSHAEDDVTRILEVAQHQTIAGFGSSTSASSIMVSSGKTLTVAPTVHDTGFFGVISGAGGNLAVGASEGGYGVGLFGDNTYTGTTTIAAGGVLMLGQNTSTGSIAPTSAVTNNGTLIFNRDDTMRFDNTITGSGAVVQGVIGIPEVQMETEGATVLTAASNYTGGTTINAGLLGVAHNSALGTGTVTLNGGALATTLGTTINNPLTLNEGYLAGNGSYGTAVIGANVGVGAERAVLSGEEMDGGESTIGVLGFTNLTLAGGGTLLFNVISPTGGAGVGWDLLNTQTLTIASTSANRFTILVESLAAPGTPGTATGFSPNQNYTWTVIAASSIVGGFSTQKFTIDDSIFMNNLGGGTFTLTTNLSNDLVLNFTAVPEPSTWMMLIAGIGAVTLLARRRVLRHR